MKVAIYCRVSTDEQTDLNQAFILRDWAKGRGLEILQEYQETGSAFQHADQKELRRCVEDCRLGKIDTVLVYDMSRLTRQGALENLLCLRKFAEVGATVMSYRESWVQQIANPYLREALVGLIAYMNADDSKLKSEKTGAGMARARLQGKHIGRPRKNCVTFITCQRIQRTPNGCKECSGYEKKGVTKDPIPFSVK